MKVCQYAITNNKVAQCFNFTSIKYVFKLTFKNVLHDVNFLEKGGKLGTKCAYILC
jgi:hypothetical protein